MKIWGRFMKWLRTFRKCEHCGRRSYDSTKGSSFCGLCDGGYEPLDYLDEKGM